MSGRSCRCRGVGQDIQQLHQGRDKEMEVITKGAPEASDAPQYQIKPIELSCGGGVLTVAGSPLGYLDLTCVNACQDLGNKTRYIDAKFIRDTVCHLLN